MFTCPIYQFYKHSGQSRTLSNFLEFGTIYLVLYIFKYIMFMDRFCYDILLLYCIFWSTPLLIPFAFNLKFSYIFLCSFVVLNMFCCFKHFFFWKKISYVDTYAISANARKYLSMNCIFVSLLALLLSFLLRPSFQTIGNTSMSFTPLTSIYTLL